MVGTPASGRAPHDDVPCPPARAGRYHADPAEHDRVLRRPGTARRSGPCPPRPAPPRARPAAGPAPLPAPPPPPSGCPSLPPQLAVDRPLLTQYWSWISGLV